MPHVQSPSWARTTDQQPDPTPRWSARWCRAAFLAALAFVVLIVHDAPRPRTRTPAPLQVDHNGVLPPADSLPFRFETLDHPTLDRLAAREHLRDLAASGRQFDRILRVKNWVSAQWADGVPDPYPPWDALIVLDWIRAGKTGGACGQFAQVFLQSLAALGFSARYVEIGSRDNPYAHYVTEVWSNEFDKWVLMDADYNVHFERGGVPLNALELHDALLDDTLASVRPVLGTTRQGHPIPSMWPKQTAEFYRYLRFHTKADHLASPDEPPFDRFNDMIEFEDPRVEPWERNPVQSPFPKERLTKQRTSDRDAVYARLNQIQLDVLGSTPGAAVVALRNNVPQFDRYEFRIVDAPGGDTAWQSLRESTLTWPSPDPGSSLEVRGVNVRGVAGPSSRISAQETDAPLDARRSAPEKALRMDMLRPPAWIVDTSRGSSPTALWLALP
jgi:hypothetical protein